MQTLSDKTRKSLRKLSFQELLEFYAQGREERKMRKLNPKVRKAIDKDRGLLDFLYGIEGKNMGSKREAIHDTIMQLINIENFLKKVIKDNKRNIDINCNDSSNLYYYNFEDDADTMLEETVSVKEELKKEFKEYWNG